MEKDEQTELLNDILKETEKLIKIFVASIKTFEINKEIVIRGFTLVF